MSKHNMLVPLDVNVKDGKLVVEIGIRTLAWAAQPENGGPLRGCHVEPSRSLEWATDVVNAISHEDEVGSTPLQRFLDEMMQAAVDGGSTALVYESNSRRRP